MPVPNRVNLITLGVADVAAATAFYSALGWTPAAASNPQITFIKLHNVVLSLFERTALATDASLPDEPRAPFDGVTLAINVASEAEVQPTLDAAVAAGATLLKAAERAEWGGISGYFADPDGHAWEVAFNPFAPLDADGRMTLA